MSDFQLCKRLLYLDKLIDREATGSHEVLANRLGISVPTLYRHLARLRAAGGSIDYCSQRQTYYYLNDRRFFWGYYPKGEEPDE